MQSHQLINQTSGAVNYFSPPHIVEVARQVMGGIDLDPASCREANEMIVKAERYYSDDPLRSGLLNPWNGRVWMNHPFRKTERACKKACTKRICVKRGYCIEEDILGNEYWINKLIWAYERGDVKQAFCLTFASLSEGWFAPLLKYPIGFIYGRLNYYRYDPVEGNELIKGVLGEVKGVPKGSCLTYLPPKEGEFNDHIAWFKHFFKDIGIVKT